MVSEFMGSKAMTIESGWRTTPRSIGWHCAFEKMRFGTYIRRNREAHRIGLREMAKMLRVSPTYLSMIERNKCSPPDIRKILVIARVFWLNTDDLLARAGRVSKDVTDIILRKPAQLAALLRATVDLQSSEIALLIKQAHRGYRRTATGGTGQSKKEAKYNGIRNWNDRQSHTDR